MTTLNRIQPDKVPHIDQEILDATTPIFSITILVQFGLYHFKKAPEHYMEGPYDLEGFLNGGD